jgi:DNA polymerase-3 subunit epsilon
MALIEAKSKEKLPQKLYAVVDIETTGGSVSGSRITEVAILLHNGVSVMASWHSLVNPEMDIPMHITALTGIDDEMVAKAPTFATLADEIYSILSDKIFVAHNVNFDYSFLRGQLAACGFTWDAPKLCTVRLSRKLFPGLPSYSLGKLCAQLGISLKDRHRATGDATATAELFTMLLAKDNEATVKQMIKKSSPEQRLPANLAAKDFNALPEAPGVYYFHDQKGKVLYVGKAVNVKKRVASHFTGNNESLRRQKFLQDIYSISFERCGSELMALLFECIEIQRLWPIYNSALKRFEPKFGLYHYVSISGYSHLAVGKLPPKQPCLKAFEREIDGLNYLSEVSTTFNIDSRFCRYGQTSRRLSDEPLPTVEEHNHTVESLIENINEQQKSFCVKLKGRTADECGFVYVEKGTLYGMGYFDTAAVPSDMEMLKDGLQRCKGTHYMMQLVNSFTQRFPSTVIKIDSAEYHLV